MSLVDTPTMLVMQGLDFVPGDPEYARYNLLREGVETRFKRFVKWPLEMATITEYYNGNHYIDIPLFKPFVSEISAVYIDPQGNYGKGPNAFPASSALTVGTDCELVIDGSSGLLRLCNSLMMWIWPSDWIYIRGPGGLAYRNPAWWPVGYGNIKVSYTFGFATDLQLIAATWSAGTMTFTTTRAHGLQVDWLISILGCVPTAWNGGSYMVESIPTSTTFTVSKGSDPAAITTLGTLNAVPSDIKMAVAIEVSIMANSTQYGFPLTSESLGARSYGLQMTDQALGILAFYRDLCIGPPP